MNLLTEPSVEAVAVAAADIVCDLLRSTPTAHLCLAAGGTPRPLYGELTRRAQAGAVSLALARITKLDEWYGLPLEHPATCETDLRQHLLDPLGLPEANYLGFDSLASDPLAECARVLAAMQERGPFDLSILGLGLNGHLGMNEPAEELQRHPHYAELSEVSRNHAMLRDTPKPPTHGMTIGMADLLQSRQVILLVTGSSKQEALQRLLDGPLTTQFPASLLHLHPNCVCVADAAAAP